MRQAEARLVSRVLVEDEEEPSPTKGCCCFCCCSDLASCVYNQALCMIVLMQAVFLYLIVTKCDSCEDRGERASFFDRVLKTKVGCSSCSRPAPDRLLLRGQHHHAHDVRRGDAAPRRPGPEAQELRVLHGAVPDHGRGLRLPAGAVGHGRRRVRRAAAGRGLRPRRPLGESHQPLRSGRPRRPGPAPAPRRGALLHGERLEPLQGLQEPSAVGGALLLHRVASHVGSAYRLFLHFLVCISM